MTFPLPRSSRAVGAMLAMLLACQAMASPAAAQRTISNETHAFITVRINPGRDHLAAALQAEASRAGALQRPAFAYFYADWCGPCRRVRENLTDPRMVEAFDGIYLIQVDATDWDDLPVSTAGFLVDVLPKFFELDAAGQSTGRSIDGGAWEDDIPENIAPPLRGFFHAAKP